MVNNMNELQKIQIELVTDPAELTIGVNDFENIIFDLNSQIEMLSSKADKWDCLVALGSGIVCGMMDIVEYPDVNNLFAITDIDTFLDIKAIIRGHADFDDVNKACGNGFLKSALNWYEKFLNIRGFFGCSTYPW